MRVTNAGSELITGFDDEGGGVSAVNANTNAITGSRATNMDMHGLHLAIEVYALLNFPDSAIEPLMPGICWRSALRAFVFDIRVV